MTLLLREAIGGSLRRARAARHRTLRDVSAAARVSLGYLSEVERGRKEASSELLAAICDALELPLPELLHAAAATLRPDRLEPAEGAGVFEAGRLVGATPGVDAAELRLAPVLARPLPVGVRVAPEVSPVERLGSRGGVVVAA